MIRLGQYRTPWADQSRHKTPLFSAICSILVMGRRGTRKSHFDDFTGDADIPFEVIYHVETCNTSGTVILFDPDLYSFQQEVVCLAHVCYCAKTSSKLLQPDRQPKFFKK